MDNSILRRPTELDPVLLAVRYQYPFGGNSAWSVVCGWAVGVVGVVCLPSIRVLGSLGCWGGWAATVAGVVGLLGWVVWFFSTEVGWLGCRDG